MEWGRGQYHGNGVGMGTKIVPVPVQLSNTDLRIIVLFLSGLPSLWIFSVRAVIVVSFFCGLVD